MARIAEGTCATCHTIRPKNEMREVAVSRRVGTRYGFSHSRRGNRESASAQYARKFVWVCKGCRAPKSDGLIPWKTLIALAAAAIAYVWFTGQQGAAVRGVSHLVTSTTSRTAKADGPAFKVDDAPAETDSVSEVASTSDAVSDAAPTIGAAATPPTAFAWDQDAIQLATIEALDKGKPRKWKVGGVKGQAIPSGPTVTPGEGECRNVYQTARIDGETQTSETVTWCRAGGEGQWDVRR